MMRIKKRVNIFLGWKMHINTLQEKYVKEKKSLSRGEFH